MTLQGTPTVDLEVAERCVQLADELTSLGQVLAAAQAYAVLARNDASAAQIGLDRLSLRQADVPLDHRLTVLDVLARARLARGDDHGALRATRSAIDLGNRHRLLRGSADLRAAVRAQMDAIAQFGLSLRRDANRAIAVLYWVDRCHDLTMTATDMLLDNSPERGDLLAALRSSQQRLREASVDDAPALMREQARLQRGSLPPTDSPAADRIVVGDSLATSAPDFEASLSCSTTGTEAAWARSSRSTGCARIVDLGSLDEIDATVELLRRSLRRLTQSYASGVNDRARSPVCGVTPRRSRLSSSRRLPTAPDATTQPPPRRLCWFRFHMARAFRGRCCPRCRVDL